MNTKKRNIMTKILPMVLVLFWIGCEDLDFPDPNNPTSDTATLQSLVTGAENSLDVIFMIPSSSLPLQENNKNETKPKNRICL